MKKLFYVNLFVVAAICCSCSGILGGSSNLPNGDVDYQMFSNETQLKKIYDEIFERLGENVHAVDEIRLDILRPSKEGSIIKEGKPDEFYLTISHLYKEDKKKLYVMDYGSGGQGWFSQGPREVQLIGGGDAESFRLEDEMFDLSALTFEVFYKITQDAMSKYKDTEKYSYQYIKDITIKEDAVSLTVYGKLAANDLEKKNYYSADFKGNAKR
jgi:hypothetical protein